MPMCFMAAVWFLTCVSGGDQVNAIRALEHGCTVIRISYLTVILQPTCPTTFECHRAVKFVDLPNVSQAEGSDQHEHFVR